MSSKFERKFSRYAVKNLTLYLIIGYVVGYAISFINPMLYSYLTLDPYAVFHGQIWRVVTWIITMPEQLSIFTIIMLFLYYSLGNSLERTWGTFRYNVYLVSGFLFTIVGSFVLYFVLGAIYGQGIDIAYAALGQNIGMCVSTYYINMSIFLAFAATYPDMELMLYFIIPIKVKWFGILYSALIIFDIVGAFRNYNIVQAIIITVVIVMSLLNFLLYLFKGRQFQRFKPSQVKRKQQYKREVHQARTQTYSNGAKHKCAVCGRTELDNPNLTFRYCSKCTGNKEYCEEHLFTHTHS